MRASILAKGLQKCLVITRLPFFKHNKNTNMKFDLHQLLEGNYNISLNS